MQTISLNELAELPHGTFFLVTNVGTCEAAMFDVLADAMLAAGYPRDDIPPTDYGATSALAEHFRELYASDDDLPNGDPLPIVPISRDMVQAIKDGHGNEARGRLELMTRLVKDVWDNNVIQPEFVDYTNYDLAVHMIAYNDAIALNGIDTGNIGADYEALAKEVAGILEGIRNVSNEQGTGGTKAPEGDQGTTASA